VPVVKLSFSALLSESFSFFFANLRLFFHLVTNGMFTGFGIVQYDGDAIIGSTSPAQGPPPFLGDGRIAFAPVEDLLFGFSLVLLSLTLWVWWGRRGVQRTPLAGPPLWRRDSRD